MKYCITKVRLVNFHNLGTVTLDIRDGGHLFLLGDNGSGKTTVLDAIHFVLTAGHSMEFNSAARVTGSKNSGGRNVQGIVMRYNIEADGPLNPNGGITYAALEVAAPNGRQISLCVGLSVRSMNEQYESWAAIADMPVANLPLIHEENGLQRPTTRAEFKEALNGKGYYGKVGAYADELANRFFEKPETYRDVCRLLATGKAYREIAARAGDYDKLFRELLQEPQRDVFDKLIADLRSLDESKQKLAELEKHKDFVEKIAAARGEINQIRIDGLAALWMLAELDRREATAAAQTVADKINETVAEHARLQGEAQHLSESSNRTRLRLEELRRQDPENLSVRERELRDSKNEAERKYRDAQNTVVKFQEAKTEAEDSLRHEEERFTKQLVTLATELQRAGRGLPFSVSGIVAAYDDAARAEKPEENVNDIPVAATHALAVEERVRLEREKTAAEGRRDQAQDTLSGEETELERLKAQKEYLPRLEGFADAAAAVSETMLDAFPLYRKLEPAPGLSDREVAILEQIIGDDILATWVVTPADADAARKLLFLSHPAQSIAVAKDDHPEQPCSWLNAYFDLDKSSPDALIALTNQLAAKSGPHVEKFLNESIMHFRGRERPSRYTKPRLIGGEARVAELKRKVREQEEKCALLRKAVKEEEAAVTAAAKAIDAVQKVIALLQAAPGTVSAGAHNLALSRNESEKAEIRWQNALEALYGAEDVLSVAQEKHNDILLQMKSRGVGADLEARITKTEKDCKKLETELAVCHSEIGKLESQTEALRKKAEELAAQIDKARADRSGHENALLPLVQIDGDILAFVASRCGEAKAKDALLKRANDLGLREAQLQERIRTALISDDGIQEGFVYDAVPNTIINRRGAVIDDVLAEKKKQVEEQNSLINDESRRLFQTFIMDDLLRSMQSSVMRLSDMERKMTRLLGNRQFGHNRYAFAVTPVPGYEQIIRIVKNYSSLSPAETKEDMESFVKEHLDEVIATEAGDIPAVMDYRNWFRYDLKIITENDTGKVIDRKVKSMGSGGEQAVPNYLLILTIADFLYSRDSESIRLHVLLFDEAFYGIDANRRDQILAFATDLGLQLFVASPDQDGVKKEIPLSTTVFVVKDKNFDVHLYPYFWNTRPTQGDLLEKTPERLSVGEEI